MQTNFSISQLSDPNIAEADKILRNCVHCGFCTATCPTYVTLGNELDSPRGRIYLIKDMLENDRPADEQITTHIDRCLSCLACTTTCPSGVDYMHLVDYARVKIEEENKRPFITRAIRNVLSVILPYRERFKLATRLAVLGKPVAPLLEKIDGLKPVAAMLRLAPSSLPSANEFVNPGEFKSSSPSGKRVTMLTGCAQPVLDSGINKATIELLNRLGTDVVLPPGEACCGSLVHHMGREEQAHDAAKHMVGIWHDEMEQNGLDAIIITTSGCGTTVKDYGHILRHDPEWAEKAKRVSSIVMDISEYLSSLDLPDPSNAIKLRVAYHSACSLQHGQKIKLQPKQLLAAAGFDVAEAAEAHLCCGSAGTYNIMQSEIANQLKERKVRNIEAVKPDLIAAGNIGCLTQIGSGTEIPVVHTVKLLNWAFGGNRPAELDKLFD